MVVWVSVSGANYTIKGRARSAAGAFAAAKPLSAAGTDTFYPDVAMSEAGASMVAWQRSDGHFDRIEARSVSNAGALGAIQIFSPSGQSAQYPRVLVAQSGASLIAWQRSDGTHQRVQTRTRSAAGALGDVLTHSAAGKDALNFSMAGNGNGQAVVMWTLKDASTSIVQARALTVTGAVEPVQTISAVGQVATAGDVGVDNDGSAEVAFSGNDASNVRMQVRRRSASSALDRAETLSMAGANASNPGVAVNPRGDTVIVWPLVRAPGQDDLVQVSAGP